MPLDLASICASRPQNDIHYFSTVGSTMTEAGRLAMDGARHGTVVIADEQTSGIGRLGRSWISEADAGIYLSILLQVALSPARLPLASLLLGLATAEAIEHTAGLECDIRWPNDILIHQRKVAGVLPHLVDGCVVAGIGINVNQTSMPEGLRTPPTSLRIESGGKIQQREPLVIKLLECIDTFCSMLVGNGPGSILDAFTRASSYVMGRRVTVDETGKRGTTGGLDENGFLLLKLDDGRIEKISSGSIRPDYSV
ncbi:MAG: biotin--[acetyl-CoA-carboxylase] ligase [Acidobacteriaceae bacterium]|nr:biotin--[acetyl-CoA-carboxylase] ligase [Acidobacteriaceae bacterium]MBV9499857.1 biotin--[acetyl-CoA-carboxylase] ligase [Acidobacteriaceae bacterium]